MKCSFDFFFLHKVEVVLRRIEGRALRDLATIAVICMVIIKAEDLQAATSTR